MPATSRLSASASYFQSLLRIVAGFLFLCHGAQKIFGVFGGHKAPMVSLPGLAGILELFGGALIIVGLFTRPVALVLCGEMAFAYFTMHAKHGAIPIVNQGELAVLYCFLFLWMTFAGPGPLSVDAIIRKKA
jgi:putative oxidoreductase